MLTNHERGADLPQRIRATDQCGFANAYDDCMLPCVCGPLAHHPIDLLPHFAIPNFCERHRSSPENEHWHLGGLND